MDLESATAVFIEMKAVFGYSSGKACGERGSPPAPDPRVVVAAGRAIHDAPVAAGQAATATQNGRKFRATRAIVVDAARRTPLLARLDTLEGKFEANRRSPEADFVFPITSADLLAMGQLDMISLVNDQGEVQWAFVKSPTATPQAKYVGSLKNFSQAAHDFLNYCNPK